MKISSIEISRLTIPMEPFVIATETCYTAKNIYLKINTDTDIFGVGECSPFPMLVGETQDSCFHVGKELANIIKGKDPRAIEERMNALHAHIAFNSTIKSAFDMALHDIAAKALNMPLYKFLGGQKKEIQTDLTIGISSPEKMAEKAVAFVEQGVRIIKVKLGKNGKEDVERIKKIREAVGQSIQLRIDANQGWDYATALETLQAIEPFNIAFCEQPMHHHLDPLLPALKKNVAIPIMADESCSDVYDADRLIELKACDMLNIKIGKAGGIYNSIKNVLI